MRGYKTPFSDNSRWEGFVHRAGDIFVCTPPKCGTTWMQAIVVSLLFPNGDAPQPVVVLAPWVEAFFEPVEAVLERLEKQTHRRSVKTHSPADGIPWWDDARYIVVGRDGRDAFMSWLNHVDKMHPDVFTDIVRPNDLHEYFPEWLEEGTVFHHIATFWERRAQPNVLFVHYNDLKADLEGEMPRIAAFLEIDIAEEKWPAVVDRCTFESMKARPTEIGPFENLFVGGVDSFLHKGTNERWRGVLTDEELAAYDKRVAEMLPPGAADWLAHGRAALQPR